jgi:hypothetical protein
MRGTETVTVIRSSGGFDHNGDPVGAVDEHDLTNCIVWPRTSTENAERGIVPLSGYNIWSPPGVDVKATDKIRVRDEINEVEGVPADHRKLSGRRWGVLVVTKRVGA